MVILLLVGFAGKNSQFPATDLGINKNENHNHH
jgi:hypothetical protein